MDDNTQDFTVYDLAERMAGGQQLSIAAQMEVAAELLRLRQEAAIVTGGLRNALVPGGARRMPVACELLPGEQRATWCRGPTPWDAVAT